MATTLPFFCPLKFPLWEKGVLSILFMSRFSRMCKRTCEGIEVLSKYIEILSQTQGLRRIPSPVMQNYVHEAIFCNINIFILNTSALSDGQKVKLLFEMILICLHLKFYQLGGLRESSQVMACPDLNSCMFTSLSFTLLKACASSCSLIENKFLVLCKPMPLISLFVSKDRQAG